MSVVARPARGPAASTATRENTIAGGRRRRRTIHQIGSSEQKRQHPRRRELDGPERDHARRPSAPAARLRRLDARSRDDRPRLATKLTRAIAAHRTPRKLDEIGVGQHARQPILRARSAAARTARWSSVLVSDSDAARVARREIVAQHFDHRARRSVLARPRRARPSASMRSNSASARSNGSMTTQPASAFAAAPDPPPDQQAEPMIAAAMSAHSHQGNGFELEQRARRLGNALRAVRRKHAPHEHRVPVERNAPLAAVEPDDDVVEADRLRSDVPRGDAIVRVLLGRGRVGARAHGHRIERLHRGRSNPVARGNSIVAPRGRANPDRDAERIADAHAVRRDRDARLHRDLLRVARAPCRRDATRRQPSPSRAREPSRRSARAHLLNPPSRACGRTGAAAP